MEVENLETFLNEKIQEFGNYLIQVCNDSEKKLLIEKTIINMKMYDIGLFMMFFKLKSDKDYEIKKLIENFSLNESIETFETIKDFVYYFIDIYEIINSVPK